MKRKSLPRIKHMPKQLKPSGMRAQVVYPFCMIVAQDEMKLALVLNVIDPSIGGVLMMGHRGTGKSTAVRALADLLPEMWVVKGCRFNCDPEDSKFLCAECREAGEGGKRLARERVSVPVVDLPLGATEDRVCGSIDIEKALTGGTKSFEPGLLARANRGFLYIDEVNLLEDHLADLLLDVAVSGRNRVERESISIEHPARFVLIGSGNPEEGELRPQLQDRFGLHVEVKTENDLEQRVEIVHRRELFEREPELFLRKVEPDQQRLRKKVTQAQKRLGDVDIDRPLLRQIAQLCSELKVDGHRGELTIARAARALAVFEGRKKLSEEDVKRVALMSLRHRLRRDPLEEAGSTGRIERALEKVFQQTRNKDRGQTGGETEDEWPSELDGEDIKPDFTASAGTSSPRGQLANNSPERSLYPALEVPGPKFQINDTVGKKLDSRIAGNRNREGLGRRTRVSKHGRYIRAVRQKESDSKIALDATLRVLAATAYQKPGNRSLCQLTARISADTLRFKEYTSKRGTLFIFAIDTSGSMALNRIREAKGAIVSVLRQSYIRRDSVAIVAFGGGSAEVVLSPSRSIIRAKRALSSLAVGGGTPLSTGVAVSVDLARRSSLHHENVVLLLFTDGHANVSSHAQVSNRLARQQLIASELSSLRMELVNARVSTVLIDTQKRFMAHTEAKEVARLLGASYTQLDS